MNIDAQHLSYRQLNEKIRDMAKEHPVITITSVMGHRYIGCGMTDPVTLIIEGVPGNDMAAFMNGPKIIVRGNAQDGVGNTMNAGKLVIHGAAGDILGHSMRGGRIYVLGSVGYRTGIHIKSFMDQFPIIVIGGCVRDYLGEYMAGGMMIVLGMHKGEGQEIVGRYIGTGMHAGAIFIAGEVESYKLSLEVARAEISDEERALLTDILVDYARELDLQGFDPAAFISRFTKLAPITARPYGNIYAY
jgi:glutamate synthase domain-containing protein 3